MAESVQWTREETRNDRKALPSTQKQQGNIDSVLGCSDLRHSGIEQPTPEDLPPGGGGIEQGIDPDTSYVQNEVRNASLQIDNKSGLSLPFPTGASSSNESRNRYWSRERGTQRSPLCGRVGPSNREPVEEGGECSPDIQEVDKKERGVSGGNLLSPAGRLGYYDNYHEMKEHLSRHPRALETGAFADPHLRHNTSLEDTASLAQAPSQNQRQVAPAATVFHLTERDVHACFEGIHPSSQLQKTRRAAKDFHFQYCGNRAWWADFMKRTFPIYEAVRTYKKKYILPDFLAGLAAGVSAIPIGMSYAKLAGVRPELGLYCQLFYAFTYMFLGTGRQVCVGASAIEAMITMEAVRRVLQDSAKVETEAWHNITYGLTFFSGIFLTIARFLGLGVMASFVADSVVSGFSTGCAITIAISQLKLVFGVDVSSALSTPRLLIAICKKLPEANIACIVIGLSGIGLLTGMYILNKRVFKRFPIPNAVVFLIVFILVGYGMNINKPPFNVPIIGVINKGLPTPQAFSFEKELIGPVMTEALWYSVVYFFIHVSVSRSIAQKNEFTLDPDQELLATGVSCLVGCVFHCFPVGTSLSRTSIVDGAGAKTQLYNISNVLTILLTVTVLTPLLAYLPMAALASVVLFGVYFMMYFGEAIRLSKLLSFDFVLWLISFGVTVFWGATQGIIISIGLSLLWILKSNAFPAIRVLGRLPGTKVFRDIKVFPEALEIRGCKILRFDASLNFSNADHFERRIVQLIRSSSGGRALSVSSQDKVVEPEEDLQPVTLSLPSTPQGKAAVPSGRARAARCGCFPKGTSPINVGSAVTETQRLTAGAVGSAKAIEEPHTTIEMSINIDSSVPHTKEDSAEVGSLQEQQEQGQEVDIPSSLSVSGVTTSSTSKGTAGTQCTPGVEYAYPNDVLPVTSSMASASGTRRRLRVGSRYNRSLSAPVGVVRFENSAPMTPVLPGGSGSSVRVVIIDASSINHVDVSAIRMLKNVANRLELHNMIMLFANWKGPTRKFLEKARFYDAVPPDHCFLSIHDAVLWAEVFYLKREPSVVAESVSSDSDTVDSVDEQEDSFKNDGAKRVVTLHACPASSSLLQSSGRAASAFSAYSHPVHERPISASTPNNGVCLPVS